MSIQTSRLSSNPKSDLCRGGAKLYLFKHKLNFCHVLKSNSQPGDSKYKKQAANKAEGTKPTNLPMLSRKRVGLEKTSIHNLTLRSLARMSKIAKYKREIFSRSVFFGLISEFISTQNKV